VALTKSAFHPHSSQIVGAAVNGDGTNRSLLAIPHYPFSNYSGLPVSGLKEKSGPAVGAAFCHLKNLIKRASKETNSGQYR
jgi:hypothetical protein